MNNIKIRVPFQHRENYGPFNALLDTGTMTLRTDEINKMTYNYYLNCILNFMVDGIEHEVWHGGAKVNIIFSDGEDCVLTPNDLFFNIVMWYVAVKIDHPITSQFLFWDEYITQKTITDYINNNFLAENRKLFNNRFLNNVIADCTANLEKIDLVSTYLADTLNLYDDVLLMEKCPEYYQALHTDISNQALDKLRPAIDKAADIAINAIKNSKKYIGYNHGLMSNFISGEGLNKKQFAEVYIAIGTKPDANGDVIHHIITTSFMMGGVFDYVNRFIESYASKKATIMSHINVSDAGAFARKLILLNQTSLLHKRKGYICNTRNCEEIFIDSENTLKRLNMRYYKETPNGVVKYLSRNNKSLIGKKIYLYSPMTCASFARGEGVCYRCYGDLAYNNYDINIGILAAEILSNIFTQRMLSSKHLLETVITYIKWVEEFNIYFSVDVDQIVFNRAIDPRGYKILIKIDDVQKADDEDDDDEDYYYDDEDGFEEKFNIHNNYETEYYVTTFTLECPDGRQIEMYSESYVSMYMSKELYSAFNRESKDTDSDTVSIDIASMESSLFTISVENTELTKALTVISNIIDKVSVTKSMDRNQILQEFIAALNNANIKLNSVHAEVLLSNQIKSKDDMFINPSWEYDNAGYQLLSLRQALMNHPSFAVSMTYQDINKQLNNPRTYDKTAPSILDTAFAVRPQEYLQSVHIARKPKDIEDTLSARGIDKKTSSENELPNPFVIIKE